MRKFLLGIGILFTYSTCLAGAWGAGSFDNDDSLDWIAQCTEAQGLTIISSALRIALQPGVIEASDGSNVVAAAEVIAAAKGCPGKALPSGLNVWLNRQSKEEISKLTPVARRALIRIKEIKHNGELRVYMTDGNLGAVSTIIHLDGTHTSFERNRGSFLL